MDLEMTSEDALAALSWLSDLGVDEAIGDQPLNRFDAPKGLPKMGPSSNIQPVTKLPDFMPKSEAAADVAGLMAAKVDSLSALKDAMAIFDHCALKKGARNLVFADGLEEARVMVIGEAPDAEEDRQGKPFVGRAGQLLDKMFGAIEMGRNYTGETALYITNVIPWRPPQDREPTSEEISMMLPFLKRHVELVNPDMIVLMGNTPCQAVLGTKGITRLRGNWKEVWGKPVLPMFHPAALLRDGLRKRDAWADLLSLKERLRNGD